MLSLLVFKSFYHSQAEALRKQGINADATVSSIVLFKFINGGCFTTIRPSSKAQEMLAISRYQQIQKQKPDPLLYENPLKHGT